MNVRSRRRSCCRSSVRINEKLSELSGAQAFVFPPPAIPGVGTSGGVSFVLEDRAGKEVAFLAQNTQTFMEAARKRPEIAKVNTTLLASVPQLFARVDREKALKQGVNLGDVYSDAAGLHGRRDDQLLQPVRPRVAGLRTG